MPDLTTTKWKYCLKNSERRINKKKQLIVKKHHVEDTDEGLDYFFPTFFHTALPLPHERLETWRKERRKPSDTDTSDRLTRVFLFPPLEHSMEIN